ncbi:MAG: histidine kinase dimerization/phosphoacceptor domain -containing protein, partial [Catalinimonas sp.]
SILVVEDDAIAQLSVRAYLRNLGYERFFIVDNGEEALQIVREESIDVVLMDVMINGDLDGIETAAEIGEIRPIPVVYMTAFSDKQTYERAMATNPHGFINKPYDISAIETHIRTALKHPTTDARLNGTPQPPRFDSSQMLDLIYDTAQVGMCVTDIEGRFVKVNRAYCDHYGYSEEELIGESFTKVVPQRERAYAAQVHHSFLTGQSTESPGEWQVQCKDGSIKDIYVTAARMLAPDGHYYKVTTVTDITEQKQHMARMVRTIEEKETFVRETHHRVKNNLNVISGLLMLQSEKVRDHPDMYRIFQESTQRVKAMALVHERLYRHENLAQIDIKDYLYELVEELRRVYGGGDANVRTEVSAPSLQIDIDQAIPCGLIVNEVVSNSFKYAFTGREQGLSHVRCEELPEQKAVRIEMWDDGVGLPADFDPTTAGTLGSQLMLSLSRQMGGRLEVHAPKQGTQMTVTFPIEQ